MGKGFVGNLTIVGEWLYFLLMLQLIWFAGLILGGIVLGIFPATYAVFVIVRNRLREGDIKISRRFWKVYKTNFLKRQIGGWIWLLIGILIYYDIRLMFAYYNLFGFVVGSFFISILIIYGLCTMLLLPIYSNYELTILNRIRLALIIAVTFPHISVGLSLFTVAIYIIAIKIPTLVMLIGISLVALIYTYLSSFAFQKIEETGFIGTSIRIEEEGLHEARTK